MIYQNYWGCENNPLKFLKEKSQKHYDLNKFQHKILINNKLWLKLCQVRCLLHLIRCKIIDKQIQIRSKYQNQII